MRILTKSISSDDDEDHRPSSSSNSWNSFSPSGLEKDQQKKKVKFSNEVVKLGAVDNNPKRRVRQEISDSEGMESMPLNRQALYKGILQYKALKGYN